MKKKFLLFAALSMVFAGAMTFTSCEKDEPKEGDKTEDGGTEVKPGGSEVKPGETVKTGLVVPILVDGNWASEKESDGLVYMNLQLNTNYEDGLDPNGRVMDIWNYENTDIPTCDAVEAEKGIHIVSISNQGWCGGGFHSGAPLSLDFLLDGDWRVHFSYRSNTSFYLQFSGSKIRFDLTKTDGEWVEVDKAVADKTSKMDNAAHYYMSFGAGGEGDEFEIADVYFYLAD